jgi:23S rRNA pseudouridine2605 synthase
VQQLGLKVKTSDRVVVNGRVLDPVGTVHILLNKPAGAVSTGSDDRGRSTVLDLIPAELRTGLFPVGRLDRQTTGLLVLTNDGELANRLMHPRWEVEKIYLVETAEALSTEHVDQLRDGVMLEDGPARADNVTIPDSSDPRRVAIKIHEGRNRQVRRMIQSIGHSVVSLERIQYAGLTLSGLRRGKWRRLTQREVQRLRKLVRFS